MPSARYRSLKLNVAKLEKRFLPKKLTGPFFMRQHDLARGFRLLAHAEIEAYLEDRAREVSLAAVQKFQANNKPHVVILSLLAWKIIQSEPNEKYLRDHFAGHHDHIENVLNAANNRYQGLIRQNHGIREDNVLSLLLPIGFTAAQIDPAWLSTMNSFGRTRGETAHTSFTPTQLVDPGTEKNTVAELVDGLEPIDLVFTSLKPR
jgi:hypothetical protein